MNVNVSAHKSDLLKSYYLFGNKTCYLFICHFYYQSTALAFIALKCLFNSLEVLRHRVWKVSGPIPSQGPRHLKDVIKLVHVPR